MTTFYNETIKAIEDSIEHWKEIRRRLDYDEIYKTILLYWKGDDTSVNCYTDGCPLCKIYRPDDSDRLNESICDECPIVVFNGVDCDNYSSFWSFFTRNPNKTTADDMIINLQNILLYYQKLDSELDVWEKEKEKE
jgi:CRISPR/Cas system-associated protein Cas10 (large subunit of type III CRISPR-Cas system)